MEREAKRGRLLAVVVAAIQLGAIDCAKRVGTEEAAGGEASLSPSAIARAEGDAASEGGATAGDAGDAMEAGAASDAGGGMQVRKAPWGTVTDASAGLEGLNALGNLTVGGGSIALRSGNNTCGAVVTTGELRTTATGDAVSQVVVTSGSMPGIEKAVAGARPRFRVCYNQTLLANPGASGTVTLDLSLSAAGALSASVVSSAIADDRLSACLVRMVRALTLSSVSGPATARVNIKLTPRS